MTLTKQLLLSGIFVILCLFLGTNYFVVKNTQEFLDGQLASHSQDTATAMGLALTQIMQDNDTAIASRITDAIWDRGYYRLIEIQDANGNVIAQRKGQTKVYEVPQWFVNRFALSTERSESWIMDGWRRVGKVIIESNPGFAYKQIWMTFMDSLKWLVLTFIFAGVIGAFLLYIILSPLRSITRQASAICNQQFSIQESLPWTFDLRQVVEAMNTMSHRLKRMFEEQVQISEKLREQAYKDPVTNLGNRAYFDLQMEHLLSEQENGSGALLLIELNDFKSYNDKFGYQRADKLLQNTAHALLECCQGNDNAIVTHAKGASFFIILPDSNQTIAQELAKKIGDAFKNFYNQELSMLENVGHIGMAVYKPGDSKKEVITQADMSLRGAQAQGDNGWFGVTGARPQEVHGATEWKEIFKDVIEQNKVILHFQPVKLVNENQPKLHETLMRIFSHSNEVISAGVFMPMAEQLNQISALDKLVVANVIRRIGESDRDIELSVNLSLSSIKDEQFKSWLFAQAKVLGKKASRLVIELPEYTVINKLEMVREFYQKISTFGVKTAIDHYGKSFSSYSYLYNLKLHYLKIDGGFIRKIDENEGNQFFIRSLVEIAHSLGILVIAEAVETQQEYDALLSLQVDGLQGYFIGKPAESIE